MPNLKPEAKRSGPTQTRPSQPKRRRFKLINSARFDRMALDQEWLVEDVLIRNQPGVLGGPLKSLKTSAAIDLAISLGTGKPFLGKFSVPKVRRAALFSGESGKTTLPETARRICVAKKVQLKDCHVYWEFSLPRLVSQRDRIALTESLREKKIDVVIVDPLYLCLQDGDKTISATNLYEVGPVLRRLANACLCAGATPLLVHHTKKLADKKPEDRARPLTLSDLAFAGIGEFARQWILMKHRDEYQIGSGQHSLVVAVGGSAGHTSTWDVDIDEGRQHSDFSGRCWKTSVRRS